MAKHAVMLSVQEQKERENLQQYEEALHRERENRHRSCEIQKEELKATIVNTERKSDRAWNKVCCKLQSQVGVLQTQVAQYELQRIRQDKTWATKEDHSLGIEARLRADLTVTETVFS